MLHKLCADYQEEVKDDAPSFSFFQNIVSKEQGDDESSLALNHTGKAAPLRNGVTAGDNLSFSKSRLNCA